MDESTELKKINDMPKIDPNDKEHDLRADLDFEPINAVYIGLQEGLSGKFIPLVNVIETGNTETYNPCIHNISDYEKHKLYADANKVRPKYIKRLQNEKR